MHLGGHADNELIDKQRIEIMTKMAEELSTCIASHKAIIANARSIRASWMVEAHQAQIDVLMFQRTTLIINIEKLNKKA